MMEYENFENAFEHLKKIVQEFEDSDNISIDDLLKNYEEGMKAYSFCYKKLEDTQKKIKIIDDNFE
jgi:exodeoxyribonuclease VII small subunit